MGMLCLFCSKDDTDIEKRRESHNTRIKAQYTKSKSGSLESIKFRNDMIYFKLHNDSSKNNVSSKKFNNELIADCDKDNEDRKSKTRKEGGKKNKVIPMPTVDAWKDRD